MEFESLQDAIDAIPETPETYSGFPRVPLVWVANLIGGVNAYGKQCCKSIQGLAEPGFIQWYEWESAFSRGVGSSASPGLEPEYTDGETAPAPFTEPVTGGGQIDCPGARVPIGTWTGGQEWPGKYVVSSGSPNSEHDWGAFWAFNSCEVCGFSKYLNRNEVDGRDFISVAFKWDMVLMAVGYFMGDIYQNCIAEPRPRQYRPFFRRYHLHHMSLCQ